jgi:catechol 2,3-dioxygenase-like lactoylglutathione lyase family enzyme
VQEPGCARWHSGNGGFEGEDGFAFFEAGAVHLGCDGVAGEEFGRSGKMTAPVRRLACRETTEDSMIDHTGIGVADIRRSGAFYDAALGALGLRRVMQLPDSVGTDGIGYGVDYPVFWIDRYHPHSVRQHTAFAASSRAAVDAFYAAALKAGGNDNGPPGLRQHHYYAAFVLDPDGNNMEAVFRGD